MNFFSIFMSGAMTTQISVNGQFVDETAPCIQACDRGLLLGHGLFETVRVTHGHIIRATQHWQRLLQGAERLSISLPFDEAGFVDHIVQCVEKNHLSNCDAGCRLTVTHGVAERGLLPRAALSPTVVVQAFVRQPPAALCRLAITPIRRNEYSPLAHIKSLNYLDNILARQFALKQGADEGVLLNTQGVVTEASVANVFVVQAGVLRTPSTEEGALPGVTRGAVLALAKQCSIPIKLGHLLPDDLMRADALFITNALIGIQVACMHQGVIANEHMSPITTQLQQALERST